MNQSLEEPKVSKERVLTALANMEMCLFGKSFES